MSSDRSEARGVRAHQLHRPMYAPRLTRRGLLEQVGLGFGWLAFAGLSNRPAVGKTLSSPTLPRAKRVIFLFMDGGVSHVDSFDPKIELAKRNGEIAEWPADPKTGSIVPGPGRKWLQSPWNFAQHGNSGLWVSDLFPHMAKIVDDLCIVRSMVGEAPLHGAQNLLLHTGRTVAAAPSVGSWVSYGLGRENENLPGFVVLNNDWIPNGGFQNFASSFLPSSHQATLVRAKGNPVDNIVPSDPEAFQKAKFEWIHQQDRAFSRSRGGENEIDEAIRNDETAAAMQMLVPDLCDLSCETESTLSMYGVDRSNDYERFFATQCLRARRLIEEGVRFVEITCPNTHGNNSPWDQHGDLRKRHNENAKITDQPIAALLIDLKARGLLEETLVLWAGEMGRTPHHPGTDGRDHHVSGYTIWMAGAGLKGGMTYGETDEMGMSAIVNPVSIHDIHATILHQLGIDHTQLTFRHGGRDMRLTDVHGRVLGELLA